MRLHKCKHCGNVAWKLKDSGVPMVCCGEEMVILEANTTDAAQEKHVPVVEALDGTTRIRVGEVEHPMLQEHHIAFIMAHNSSKNRVTVQFLEPQEKPETTVLDAKEDITAYEYCNLHGFWKS